jgi:hypothetical protein
MGLNKVDVCTATAFWPAAVFWVVGSEPAMNWTGSGPTTGVPLTRIVT